MKNISLKFIIIMLALVLSINTKADLPVLTGSPASVTLPYMFNASQQGGFIDIDGNGIPDFSVRFIPPSIGETQMCYIMGLDGLGQPLTGSLQDDNYDGNGVVVEFSGIPLTPTEALQFTREPSGIFTSFYRRGELIGPEVDEDLTWFPIGMFFGDLGIPLSPSPLQNTFYDGINSGYIAVQFYIGTQLYYGWLNIEIDPNVMWVKINSAGYSPTPGTPIPAGLHDPFTVPIPLIASIIGFGLIGGGVLLKRRKKK